MVDETAGLGLTLSLFPQVLDFPGDAVLQLWQRDLDGADEHFQRALEMDPRSRQAAEGQVAVHRLRKRESSLQERDQPRSAVAGGPVRLPPFPDDHELDGESMAHSAGRRLR